MTHTDLIARLRDMGIQCCDMAADTLTAAQERIEVLEEALKEAADELDDYYMAEYPLDHILHEKIRKYLMEYNPARAALQRKEENK